MASRVQMCMKKGLISPPKWLPANIHFEGLTGSVAYGASSDTSDMDIVGFCIPPKEDIFPHLRGEIPGFGFQKQRFDVWQQHHIQDSDGKQEYDFSIYSIVKFFQLAMENNPNIVDVLFLPQRCVLFCSRIGQIVRDNRKIFLHKGSFHKFRGYLFSQLHKVESGANRSNPKRAADIEKFGFDLKFAYHICRLGQEAEQILETGDLDLERDSEMYKSIRRGEWSLQQIKDWAQNKELLLDKLYEKSTLPHKPDEEKIKRLLLDCLEEHYGSLTEAVKVEVPIETLVKELRELADRYDRK